MKWVCEVVQDLIPLYQDECCSKESRKVVEEHIAECDACRKLLDDMGREMFGKADDAEGEGSARETPRMAEEKRRMKQSFGKIRSLMRRRLAAAVVGAFALFFAGRLVVHEIVGEGLAFSNMDEVWQARQFFALVKEGNYGRAAQMMDFSKTYEALVRQLKEPVEYDYLHGYTEFVWDGKTYLAEEGCLAGCEGLEGVFGDDAGKRKTGEKKPVAVEADFWSTLLESHQENLMIPEGAWEQVVEQAGEGCDYEAADGYVRLATPWGAYYVNGTVRQYLFQALQDADISNPSVGEKINPYEMFVRAGVMPKEIYLEAEAGDLGQEMRDQQEFEEKYGYLREMSQADFVQMMQGRFIQAMEQWELDAGEIQRVSFSAANRYDGKWEIQMRVRTEEAGERHKYRFVMFFDGNGIEFEGLPIWGKRAGEKTLFDEVLHIRYDDF